MIEGQRRAANGCGYVMFRNGALGSTSVALSGLTVRRFRFPPCDPVAPGKTRCRRRVDPGAVACIMAPCWDDSWIFSLRPGSPRQTAPPLMSSRPARCRKTSTTKR